MSLRIQSYNGFEGQVELVGSRAVAAMFLRWSLERRREEGPGGEPLWTFRAVFSYQKDSLLLHPKFSRKIMVKVMPGSTWYEIQPIDGVVPVIAGTDYTIEGAKLCRADQTGRPK